MKKGELTRLFYKIISKNYIIGILWISFFCLLLNFWVSDSFYLTFLKIPILIFILFYSIMHLFLFASLFNKKTIETLSKIHIKPKESFSIKKLSRLLEIRPHVAYFLMEFIQRGGNFKIQYKSKGKIFNSPTKNKSQQIMITHR